MDHSLTHYIRVELSVLLLTLAGSLLGFWQRAVAALEARCRALAERPIACVVAIVAASIVFRLVLLTIEPVPMPLYHDEFSYLLGADTFAHGRLANPQPPVPVAFETIHTNMWPTYMSMYMPGTALVLCLGQLVGVPWLSVLLMTALFCGAIYWMASAWLPRVYALVAGVAALVITGSMNWWFDNYFCLALPGLAAALVLGSLPRIASRQSARSTIPLGIGLVGLMLTRPYEGICLSLPCVLALLWYQRGLGGRRLLALAVTPLSFLAVGLLWLLYCNERATGHPLLFSYMLNYNVYHITGPFLFSLKKPIPHYHLDMLRKFYTFAELPQYDFVVHHPFAFFAKKLTTYYYQFVVGFGAVLLLGVWYLLRHAREHLMLLPLLALGGFTAELVLMAWAPFPQYAAPAAALFFLLIAFGVFALRHGGIPGGIRISRGLVLAELLIAFNVLGLRVTHRPIYPEPQYVSKDRAYVDRQVRAHPGPQLCLVRYTPGHDGWQEWVFNTADIKGQQVIWARSLDPLTDQKLIQAFPGRTVWLVTPDFAGHLYAPYTPDGTYPLPGDEPAPADATSVQPHKPSSGDAMTR